MGTNITNGKPTKAGVCTKHYDNLGYVLGTSSDIFNGVCGDITPSNSTSDLAGVLETIVADTHAPELDDEFAVFPNPFYKVRLDLPLLAHLETCVE